MSTFFFRFIIEYIYFIPKRIFNFFLLDKNKFVKSKILFDTIQYKSEYKGDNLIFFFLPLIINISQISNDIFKSLSEKKVVNKHSRQLCRNWK